MITIIFRAFSFHGDQILAKLFHFGYIIFSTLVLACEAKDNDANGARDVPWSLHDARSWGVLGPGLF
jgi:hypothetical protein